MAAIAARTSGEVVTGGMSVMTGVPGASLISLMFAALMPCWVLKWRTTIMNALICSPYLLQKIYPVPNRTPSTADTAVIHAVAAAVNSAGVIAKVMASIVPDECFIARFYLGW